MSTENAAAMALILYLIALRGDRDHSSFVQQGHDIPYFVIDFDTQNDVVHTKNKLVPNRFDPSRFCSFRHQLEAM